MNFSWMIFLFKHPRESWKSKKYKKSCHKENKEKVQIFSKKKINYLPLNIETMISKTKVKESMKSFSRYRTSHELIDEIILGTRISVRLTENLKIEFSKRKKETKQSECRYHSCIFCSNKNSFVGAFLGGNGLEIYVYIRCCHKA